MSNAAMQFSLNAKEEDMIVHHMWPVVMQKPRCKEGFVVAIVDKYIAIFEYMAPFWQRMRQSLVGQN